MLFSCPNSGSYLECSIEKVKNNIPSALLTKMLASLNLEVAMPKYVVSAHKLIKDFQDQSLFTDDIFQSHSTTLYVSRHVMNLNH